MSSIFSSNWELLSSKDKKKYLSEAMLGMNPVIVYLDDEEDVLELIQARCREHGIEAFTSQNPEELISFLDKNQSRTLFIISDFKMPKLNGFAFRERVLEVAPDVPFYILSSYIDREIALEGIKHKITAFLEKPLHSEDLLKILRSEGEIRAQTIKDEYEMIKSFTGDVANIIEEIESACLKLEEEPHDQESISRVFGLVHTIKGSSGFFSNRTLHQFAHTFEEILKQVMNGSCHINSGMISSWLNACDILKMLNEEFITGNFIEHDVEKLKKVLDFVRSDETIIKDEKLGEGSSSSPREQKTSDLKVSMQLLNEFVQTSGELTVIRNMINKVVRSIEKQHQGEKDIVVLGELLEEMHKINSDVQSKITDLRRVPAQQLIKPLNRNLRDTCKALGKDVDFIIEGEDLRMDNSIAEVLSRCLVHLMRNSLDHGIESSDDRKKSNKPAKGKLLLKFEQKNESVIISIKDDGRGINTAKIREKVISQGLRTEAEVRGMKENELFLMIFEPGFSTAQVVSEFSGRGVGMSMVKESVESAGGTISIISEPGKGAEFTLDIPIPKSVLITSCLFVNSGGMIFGIPQEDVVRVLDMKLLSESDIDQLEGGKFIRFENKLVPVISLAKTLNVNNSQDKEKFVVILKPEGKFFALEVEGVQDIEDAVIKQLSISCLKTLSMYLGGTFLGDGTVGMIFSPKGLAEYLGVNVVKKTHHEVEDVSSKDYENLLIFELETAGVYAIKEKDLFRLEVLDKDELQHSGEFNVMPYRGSLMTILDMKRILFGQDNLCADNRGERPVIIIKDSDRYMGMMVKSLIDLESVEYNIIPSLKKQQGFSGNIIHKGKTITLIDLEEFKGLISRGNSKEDDSNFYSEKAA